MPAEARRGVEIVVVAVEHRRGRAGGRRHDPGPVGRAAAAVPLLLLQVRQEQLRLGVVVGDLNPGRLEGVQDSGVQLGDRAILPQRPRAVGAQPHQGGDFRQLVVPALVGEVTRADLRAHVPAVERRGWIADAARLQVHVTDHRDRVPAQPQLTEPGQVRVAERDLEHRVPGQFEPGGR